MYALLLLVAEPEQSGRTRTLAEATHKQVNAIFRYKIIHP
jgi:hypothetical protein